MDEEIIVEIQAFKLQIDPRIIDRFDAYLNATKAVQKRKEETRQFEFHHLQKERRPSVFDDLKSQEEKVNRKVRVRCAFVRILLFVPDMSQTSTREEFNDTFHASQLSIDIKKIVAHYSNTTDLPLLHESKKPTKIHLDLNYVNVFMQQGNTAETWFTAKTAQGKKLFSEGAICPTIEIIMQDTDHVHPTASARRSTYFGAGSDIPTNLFHFLNRNENFDGEQKLHIPMEDQSESAMIFKQSTMENSVSFYLIVLSLLFSYIHSFL